MNVVVRTDASTAIGSGHVMRCLTLADALRGAGASVMFVCREHAGNLSTMIRERGYLVAGLRVSKSKLNSSATLAHSDWLGAEWYEDVTQTGAAIAKTCAKADWLVVDHYALDDRWESALRPLADRILAVDDIADRKHDCDVLLDQNLAPAMHSRYLGLVPNKARLLLGPDYALLNPDYAEAHKRPKLRSGRVRHLFIFFGGADSCKLTLRTVSALKRLSRPEITVDVVLPFDPVMRNAVQMEVAQLANVELHSDLRTLAPLMEKADIAIGAGGATTWERLCVGLPAIVVTSADNQLAVAELLNERGLIQLLGTERVVGPSQIAEALERVIESGVDPDWSRRCLATVDGKGVLRVISALGGAPYAGTSGLNYTGAAL